MKTNKLTHTTSKTVGDEYICVTISLDDDCENGHQDFTITGDIYVANKPKIGKYHLCGGCIHDEILKHFPEFKIFIDLHLCDYNGVPMHATANGYYHLKNGFNIKLDGDLFKEKFCEYYRITPLQFDTLKNSRSEVEFAVFLKELGVLEQWKEQAKEGIAYLEKLTGNTFVNDSVKSNLHFPSDEKIQDYRDKLANGYYDPEQVEERKQIEIKKTTDTPMFTPNYHVLKIKYYGPTNISGSRVGIISERFRQRKTIDYNYEHNNSCDIAIAWLENHGFNVIGKAEGKDCYYIITDTFEPLKGDKL